MGYENCGDREKSLPCGVRHPPRELALRQLAVDVMAEVVEEIQRGQTNALEYVETSPAFVHWLTYLGIDVAAARESLRRAFAQGKRKSTPPPATPRPELHHERQTRAYPAALFLEIHQVYMDEGLSVAAAAERFGVNANTVRARFYQMGLPDNGACRQGRRKDKEAERWAHG